MSKRIMALVAAVALASGTLMAQTGGSTPRVRVTRADGKRISGRLITIDVDALTLLPDGNGDPVRIPLASISAAEVSEGKRSRVVTDLAGVHQKPSSFRRQRFVSGRSVAAHNHQRAVTLGELRLGCRDRRHRAGIGDVHSAKRLNFRLGFDSRHVHRD
jgi:hypothetical protein